MNKLFRISDFGFRICAALCLCASVVSAPAASTRIYGSVQFTNNPAATNRIIVNGETRFFNTGVTNTAAWIVISNTVAQTVTNYYQDVVQFNYTNNVEIDYTNATNVILIADVDQPLSITFGTNNFAIVTYRTNTVYLGEAVSMPFVNENTQSKTNIATGLVLGIDGWAWDKFTPTNLALQNYVSLGVTQTITNKTLTNSLFQGGKLTNNQIIRATIAPATAAAASTNGIIFASTPGGITAHLSADGDGYPVLYDANMNPLDVFSASSASPVVMNWFSAFKYLPQLGTLLSTNRWTSSNYFLGAISMAGMTATQANILKATITNAAIASSGATITNLDAGTGGSATLTNLNFAAVNGTATNLNAGVAGGAVTITNASLAVKMETVTNSTIYTAQITNANIGAVSIAATNLNAFGGSVSNSILQNDTATNLFLTGSNRANAIFYSRYDLSSLAIGNNIAVPIGTNEFVRIPVGGLTAGPTICGLVGAPASGGADGQRVWILNDSTYTLTFAQNTVDPVPANRLNTDSGSDVTVPYKGTILLWYDTANSRWRVGDIYPQSLTANATNAVAFTDGNATNLNIWANSITKAPFTANAQTGSITNTWQALNTNAAAVAFVSSNNVFTVSNLTILGSGPASNAFWRCTNATTGQGEWTSLVSMGNLISLTNQILQLPVSSAKLPGTNMAYFEGGYQDWELSFPRTNTAGTDIALSATWQFLVPNDYATNTMSLRLLHSITATNGPNVSNVVWRASFYHNEPGNTNQDIRVGSFGTAYLCTNVWPGTFNGTNILAANTINFTNQSGLSPNGFGILKVERVSTSDGYVGAAALVSVSLEYGKQ